MLVTDTYIKRLKAVLKRFTLRRLRTP